MIWIAILIVMFIIIISLVIFAPKSKNFYNCNDLYPDVGNINIEENISDIKKEIESINDKDWIDYYGQNLWGSNTAEFKIFPLYMDRKHIGKNIDQCAKLFSQIKYIKNVRNIFLGKFSPRSKLNEWQEYGDAVNNNLRCYIGLKTKPFGSKRINVWVNGEIKELNTGTILVVDHSKKNSICNDTKNPCIILFIDIDRPYDMPKGESCAEKPDDYDALHLML